MTSFAAILESVLLYPSRRSTKQITQLFRKTSRCPQHHYQPHREQRGMQLCSQGAKVSVSLCH
jgi:hypothetical protein